MSDIAARVRQVVIDELAADPAKVIDTASIIDDLNADSLETVALILAIEEKFGIEISDSEAETALTVGDIVRLVESRQAKAA